MKSICILLQNFYDFDIRVRRKAEALIVAGYSVDVLALQGKDRPKNYELEGVNVYTLKLGKERGSLARYAFEYLAFFVWAFFRVAALSRSRKYVLVDVNTLPDFLVFAAAPARWHGAKIVLDMHEITPEFYISKYRIAETSWLIRFLKYQERVSFQYADHVLTINEPIESLLCGRGLAREKSCIVMNSADESNFVPGSNTSSAADAAATPASFRMIYHGTLTRLYGLDIAIAAFAIAEKDMPGAELWILGGGPESGPLKQLAKERGLETKVRLLGLVKPSEIHAWLAKCDVGVLPIRRDVFLEFAFPNKLPEYIIMGNTVIISRLRAIQHYFTDQALAFFEPNDPSDLAKQMVRMYREPATRSHLAANAREEYAPIRWDIMKNRYLNLVRGLIGDPIPVAEMMESEGTSAASR